MARYYLHLRDGQDIALDEEGSEFADPEALNAAMTNAARDIMAHDALTGRIDLRLRIDAETASGQLVHSVPFADVIVIEPLSAAA